MAAQLDRPATATWRSAVVNGYALSSDIAAMAIGGWSGDPVPSLDEFISDHEGTYYVSGGLTGDMASLSPQFQEWVEANLVAATVGGATVYDRSFYAG